MLNWGRSFSWPLRVTALLLLVGVGTARPSVVAGQGTATQVRPQSQTPGADFPPELVNWKPRAGNPVFEGAGPGHWDAKIRERGWVMRDGDGWRMWYTGYDGTRAGIKLLGYATSPDGIHWTRWPRNPLVGDHWIEDMMVVRAGDVYYMFAEGDKDNHAVMLTSRDGVEWKLEGELDVRKANGEETARRPCGTPTVWVENGTWYLFYEWMDRGIWLAKTKDPMSRVWMNVQDDPVLRRGKRGYDRDLLALDQIFKHGDTYFAIYHGSGSGERMPRVWNTNIARSKDLLRWEKYAGNPIVKGDKSSGMVVPVGGGYRLYTMHSSVDVFESGK